MDTPTFQPDQTIQRRTIRFLPFFIGAIFIIGLAVFISMWWGSRGLFSNYPTEQLNLTVWSPDEDAPAFQKIIADYQKKHKNVSISLIPQDPGTYDQALSGAFAKSTAPDIVALHNGWLPRYQPSLAASPGNELTPARLTAFQPVVTADFVSQDKVWGVPLSTSALTLFYHKDLLQKAGVAAPSDWSQIIAAIPKLSTKDGLSVTQTALAMGTSATTRSGTDILQLLMLQNGTQMDQTDHSKTTFTAAEKGTDYFPGAKALEFYTSFALPTKETFNFTDSLGDDAALFTAGKSAMLIGPTALGPQLKTGAADLGVAPLPQVKAGESVNLADYWAYGVSRSSRNAYVAWDFLRFASSADEDKAYTATRQRLSPRLDLARSEQNDALLGPAAKQVVAGDGKNFLSWYGLHWPESDAAFGGAINDILSGKATSQQALDTAAKSLDATLAATKTRLDASR